MINTETSRGIQEKGFRKIYYEAKFELELLLRHSQHVGEDDSAKYFDWKENCRFKIKMCEAFFPRFKKEKVF